MELNKQVYYTLLGMLLDPLDDVENLFEEGKPCEQWYSDVYDAYMRLCDRLGVQDEDKDVEIIISSLLRIQDKIAYQMYHYGATFGYEKNNPTI